MLVLARRLATRSFVSLASQDKQSRRVGVAVSYARWNECPIHTPTFLSPNPPSVDAALDTTLWTLLCRGRGARPGEAGVSLLLVIVADGPLQGARSPRCTTST